MVFVRDRLAPLVEVVVCDSIDDRIWLKIRGDSYTDLYFCLCYNTAG